MHILKQATIFEFLNLNIYENFAIFKSPKKIPIMWMDYFFHAAQGLEESRQANEKVFNILREWVRLPVLRHMLKHVPRHVL